MDDLRDAWKNNLRTGVWAKRCTLLLSALVVLAVLLVPVPRKGRDGTRASAHNDARQLENAIRAYYMEYFEYPIPAGADGPHLTEGLLMEVLMNQDVPRAQHRNSRGLKWFEPSRLAEKEDRPGYHRPTGTFRDPWGTPYQLFMDLDGNGELLLPDYYNDRLGRDRRRTKTVFVHSAGPDKKFERADDNITSWDW